MRAGPLDVVEHGEQLADELGAGRDQHGLAVAVDAPPVVRVLGGYPLQVGGALGDLGGQLGGARVVGASSTGRTAAGRAAPRTVRGAHLPGLRVDPAPVAHHDPLAVAVVSALGHDAASREGLRP